MKEVKKGRNEVLVEGKKACVGGVKRIVEREEELRFSEGNERSTGEGISVWMSGRVEGGGKRWF